MSAFFIRFVSWWFAFAAITVVVFLMGITKYRHDEWKQFLTPEALPGFALTLAAIFTVAAAGIAFIAGLKDKPTIRH
ncbi:hypothetical protein OVA03_01045 [Asticcacaulis sp. SL142]|uniref:hypothetical protein n=1 Tax=Asticcacaulis sp. SL142 TaxID=2995155 RepID=UPI00226CDA1D|nr:hypothetical protein [Asticcacaulis sp. SL142]WAC48553.1 hypothetical protein OVA03_01045 [Asticcacaulis sp. SL142]